MSRAVGRCATRERETSTQRFTDAAQLLELDRAGAAGRPICVEHAHEPEQIAQRTQRDGIMPIGHSPALAGAARGGKCRGAQPFPTVFFQAGRELSSFHQRVTWGCSVIFTPAGVGARYSKYGAKQTSAIENELPAR